MSYVPALDGVRALAILLVLSLHCFDLPPGGAVGVDLFFVLSGFLITTLLLEERALTGRIRLGAFYVRRARRLFPALAAFMVIYLIVTTAAGEHLFLGAAAGSFYVANIFMAFGHPDLIMHARLGRFWSLAQEEQFYLVWPWLLLLFARSRRLVTWIVALAVVLAAYRAGLALSGQSGNRVYYGPDTHASGLIVGAALAAARLRWGLSAGEWAGQVGLAALVPAAFFGWLVSGWDVWAQPLFEVAVALLIAAAVSDTALSRGLASPLLVWIGQRSYSMYLWQGAALAGAFSLFGSGYPARVAALSATFVAAALSYRFVETPFRRRRRAGPEPAPKVVGLVPRASATQVAAPLLEQDARGELGVVAVLE